MKKIIRVTQHELSHFEDNSTQTPYVRLRGVDNYRSPITVMMYGENGEALDRAIDDALPEGQDVSEVPVYIEVRGKMVHRKKNGEVLRSPYMRAQEFSMLSGPLLELKRLQYAAEGLLKACDELTAKGDIEQAYSHLRQFLEQAATPSLGRTAVSPEVATHKQDPLPARKQDEPTAQPADAGAPAETASSKEAEVKAETGPEEEAHEKLSGDKVFSDSPDPEAAAARQMGLNASEQAPEPEATSGKEAASVPAGKEDSAVAEDPFAAGPKKSKKAERPTQKPTDSSPATKSREDTAPSQSSAAISSPFASPF